MTRGQQKAKIAHKNDTNIEMFFVQSSKNDKIDGDLSHITYDHCEMKGHYSKEWSKRANNMHATVISKENE